MKTNETTAKGSLRMRRIQRTSGIIRAIFLGGLIVQGLAMISAVIILPMILLHDRDQMSPVVYKNGSALISLPFNFMATLNFFHVFTRLKNGELFDSQTIRFLENAGKWWIVLGIVRAITECIDSYFFHSRNFVVTGNGIVAGLIVFFIAWVLREAQELKEEQALTV